MTDKLISVGIASTKQPKDLHSDIKLKQTPKLLVADDSESKREHCLVCRDRGMPGGCPSCGRKNDSRPEQIAVTEEILLDHSIPEQYKGIMWNETILRKDYQTLNESAGFNAYVSKLSRVYDIFEKGGIPKTSIVIMAPRRYGKMTWAYSCMQQALIHGYSVAPMLDNTQYSRLNILCSERPNSRYIRRLGYQIEDVDFADIVFMTVDKMNWAGAFRVFDSLIDKRTRLGKPTFIISRFSMIEMTRADSFDDAAAGFVDTSRRNNILKYPTIIECAAKPKIP